MAYDSAKPATGGSLVAADMRENFRALKEDGITVPLDGSVVVAKIGTAAVTQSKLKTSQGSISDTGTLSHYTLPGGEYGFYPKIKKDVAGTLSAGIADSYTATTSYVAIGYLFAHSANTAYMQQRYITSSGEIFWIFILRDKVTKKIKSMWQGPDHPCFGNGGKPILCPHPFLDCDPATQEVIVINPSKEEVLVLQKSMINKVEDQPDRDLLEVITEEYDIDEDSNPDWPSIPVTVGLPNEWEDAWHTRQSVQIKKKVISKPQNVIARNLVRKSI